MFKGRRSATGVICCPTGAPGPYQGPPGPPESLTISSSRHTGGHWSSAATCLPAPWARATTGYRLADEASHVDFTYRFEADTEVIGYPVLTVWASVEGHDDGDLHVHVEKLDARGRQLWHQTVTLGLPLARTWMPIAHRRGVKQVALAFYGGPHGPLRLSRRGLDPASPADRPTLSLREEHRLTLGEVVEAAIPLWPTAMRWHTGELVGLRISGRRLLPSVLPGLAEEPLQPGDRHILHTGGRYPSRLLLPTTPA